MASYDRQREIKAFDDTKAGVKGLVDSGVTEVPRFFHHPPETMIEPNPTSPARPEIPVIVLGDSMSRESLVELVREASETFGFFQVLNHGVPQAVLDEMLQGVRRFNEQDLELKMRYYTRDYSKTVRFNSNFDLYQSPAANWRDTLLCSLSPEPAAKPEELPEACRDIIMEYMGHIQRLGHFLFELLSEGLGLHTQYLNELECGEGLTHLSHYYPPCPEPQLALGTSKHADPDFLTILLQDNIGGSQVLHQNQWIDVAPIPGAFVINIGDLLQLITNDTFKSVEHRVRSSKIGPRVSVACFFTTHYCPIERQYGPMKQQIIDPTPHLRLVSAAPGVIILLNNLREINRGKISCDIELLLGHHPLNIGLLEDGMSNWRAVTAAITCVVFDIVNSLRIRCGNNCLRRSCCRAEATILKSTW